VDKPSTPAEPPAPVQKARNICPGPFLWIIVLVLIVYPLSVGPAAMLAWKQPATAPALSAIYFPLEKLVRSCEPLTEFFDAYMSLWAPP
jgi:hypothetical protein